MYFISFADISWMCDACRRWSLRRNSSSIPEGRDVLMKFPVFSTTHRLGMRWLTSRSAATKNVRFAKVKAAVHRPSLRFVSPDGPGAVAVTVVFASRLAWVSTVVYLLR